MQHELEVAAAAGALGSIDANTGDCCWAGTRTSFRPTFI
jgi:xylose isomerase